MKSFRKITTLALAMLLILECFAGAALATTPDAAEEPLVVADEAVAELASSEPESSEAESSVPESSEAEPSEPESSVPENTVPESSEAESSVPESSEQESSVPESSEPEPSVPESSVPDVTVPESSEPESSEPEPSVPESSEPEPSVPESSEPEPSVPESSEPEPSEPEPSEPTIVASGKCGDNLTWTLDSDGLLVISGKGAIPDYPYGSPWNAYEVNKLIIEEGVTAIGHSAFWEAKISSVTFPSTLKTIKSYAFEGCINLEEINLPSSLKTIENDAFAYCASLEVVVIPNSVTTLQSFAFSNCRKLVFVQLPNSLKSIAYRLFDGCAALESIVIPASVTTIEQAAFDECTSLKEINYLGTLKQFNNLKIDPTFNDILFEEIWYLATMITKQPKDLCIAEGKTATFSVAVSRANCKFKWYCLTPGSEVWEPCSSKSSTSATFSFTAKAKHNGNQYRCEITDEFGSKGFCDSATLTIAPKPKITKQPENAEAKNGKSISVSVEATGEGLTYQWYIAKKGSSKFSKSSITTNTYKTTMKDSVDGRKVYCVITDKYGQSVKTKTVTLSLETTPLVITKQPENVTVKYGENAKVTVAAEGDGLTYQWYFAKKGSTKFSKASIKKATYSVEMNTSRDGRQLYCVIKDKYGKSVKTDVVTINLEKTPLEIVTQPVGVTAGYGKAATVSVKAQGDGLTYQWYYAKKGSTKFSKASITKATYSVDMTASRDGRQLYCVITDAYGNSVKTDVVAISIERKELAIVTQPVSVSVKNGKTAKVSVSATGDGLTYQWYYAAKGSKKFKKASITKATYSVVMNSSRNGRQLYCVITDAYGNTVRTNTVTIKKK